MDAWWSRGRRRESARRRPAAWRRRASLSSPRPGVARLRELARQIGCEFFPADLTDAGDVARLVGFLEEGEPVTALVDNAGGAIGLDSVADGDPADWLAMYEKNVLGTLRLTQALLPGLRRTGGDIVFVTSMAAQ